MTNGYLIKIVSSKYLYDVAIENHVILSPGVVLFVISELDSTLLCLSSEGRYGSIWKDVNDCGFSYERL